jgi:hypothetical protein
MSKIVPSSLLADIQASVSTLAVCMRIRREDGIIYRVTNHDTDIVFGGELYDHKVPFTLSAISTTSQINVDNADLSLFCDGETFKAADFKNGAFGHAEVEIFLVDYVIPDHGRMILRQGWFGPIEVMENNVARITIFGLLKVLDFEVGRVYQPSCDADFGDKRCKVAVDWSQQRDYRRTYRAGDWAYTFATGAANTLTVVNPSFEDSSPVGIASEIPGWTRSANASFITGPSGEELSPTPPPPAPTNGAYRLTCAQDTIVPPASQYLFQDIDLREVGTIEFTDPAVEDDELTVSDGAIIATYVFKSAPSLPGEVAIGISAAECAENLQQALLTSNLDIEVSVSSATVTIKNNRANGEIVEVADTSSAIIVTDFAHPDGLDPADIDLGTQCAAFFVDMAHTLYFLDAPGLRAEVMDKDGRVIDSIDTGYIFLNEDSEAEVSEWRTKCLVFPLLSEARKIRLYLQMYKFDGDGFNVVFDNVRAFWWDHDAGNPWGDCIQKVSRVVSWDANQQYLPTNPSFEREVSVANSNVTAITGWTRGSSADWWRVLNNPSSPPAPDGTNYLLGGDDSSGTQKTYQLYQTKTMVFWNIDTARVDLGKVVGRLRFDGVWVDDDSAISVAVDFLDATDTLISTFLALDFTTAPTAAPTTAGFNRVFAVPALTRTVKLVLYARSPVGASLANAGFDNFRFYFIDGDRPAKTDPIRANGVVNTVFSNVPDTYTVDGPLIWKAHTHHVGFDEVASVLSRKEFFGTTITGGDSAYTTSLIRWISGANKGARNIIRVFDGDDQRIKLYFKCLHDIQPGDRFMYIRSCQKRFTEDCVLNFDNALNFRGFPYLPGRLNE